MVRLKRVGPQSVFARQAKSPVLLLATILIAVPLHGAVVGSIAGLVRDDQGIPQIGAAVTLLSAEGASLRRVYTNDRGLFTIGDLFPGFYGVKVSIPHLLPALRERILIRPGLRSYLDVQVANLLTSIQLVSPPGGEWRDMTEDWKWVLRTAASTRPVLRLAPLEDKETRAVLRKANGAFGEVQGMVKLSAGDGGWTSGFGSEADLGTAFAVATSLFGNNNLLVSGNLGYDGTRGAPSAGFHTSYSRELPYGAQPEVSVTVRQLFRPVDAGRALFGPSTRNGAMLQMFTFGFQDQVPIGDRAELEYGLRYDSLSFLNRLNYVSPFGKLTYRLGEDTRVILRYASGVPQLNSEFGGEGAMSRNLSALAVYPRLSLQGGRPTLQRGEHIEVGVEQQIGGDTVEIAAYRDSFANTAVTSMVPAGLYASGDILPDLFSDTYTLNAGSYQVSGYRAAYSHKWNNSVRTAVAYGSGGVLAAERDTLTTNSPGELRSILKPRREHTVTAQLMAQLSQTRTRLSSSYQWASMTSVTPPDLFNVSETRAPPGLNVAVKQPLPQVAYLPGRFEATAEIRNLLSQGYVSLQTADGRRMFLIQAARSFRGGLNFVF